MLDNVDLSLTLINCKQIIILRRIVEYLHCTPLQRVFSDKTLVFISKGAYCFEG